MLPLAPPLGKRIAGQRKIEANIFRECEDVSMQCDEPRGMPESPLHVHHGKRHTRDIDGGDVEDLQMMAPSDEPLVVRTSQDPPGAELLFEANQARRGGHLVHCLGVLRNPDVNPGKPLMRRPLHDFIHDRVDGIQMLELVQEHIIETQRHLRIADKN